MPFAEQFDSMQKRAHLIAVKSGWWDDYEKDSDARHKGSLIALMHSELSEALEGLRADLRSDKIIGFLSIEEEFADVIIRIMDMSSKFNYRIGDAIEAKMLHNENRRYRHGNKKL